MPLLSFHSDDLFVSDNAGFHSLQVDSVTSVRAFALVALAVALFAAPILSLAGQYQGAWQAETTSSGPVFSYKVELLEHTSRVSGTWSVEGPIGAAFGCLRGTAGRRFALASICTVDGSIGAKDSHSVCPDFQKGTERFIRKGALMVWQTRSAAGERWRPFLVLRRGAAAPRISDREDPCKKEGAGS